MRQALKLLCRSNTRTWSHRRFSLSFSSKWSSLLWDYSIEKPGFSGPHSKPFRSETFGACRFGRLGHSNLCPKSPGQSNAQHSTCASSTRHSAATTYHTPLDPQQLHTSAYICQLLPWRPPPNSATIWPPSTSNRPRRLHRLAVHPPLTSLAGHPPRAIGRRRHRHSPRHSGHSPYHH